MLTDIDRSLAAMESFRMLTVQVDLDSRQRGGSALLLPLKDAWLASHTCRQFMQYVLDGHFTDKKDALARAESVALYYVKKPSNISGAGSCRATLANATVCLDLEVLSVIDAFATLHFTFNIASLPSANPVLATINAFDLIRRAQTSFLAVPPRLDHAKMYSNHHAYNDLIAFLEKHELGWTTDRALTYGKRFVGGMSKAIF